MTINTILKKYEHLIKDWDYDEQTDGNLYYIYLKKPYVSKCEGYEHDMISGYIDDLEYWLKNVYKIDAEQWDNL